MGFDNGVAILCDLVLPRKKRGDRTRTVLTQQGGCW